MKRFLISPVDRFEFVKTQYMATQNEAKLYQRTNKPNRSLTPLFSIADPFARRVTFSDKDKIQHLFRKYAVCVCSTNFIF